MYRLEVEALWYLLVASVCLANLSEAAPKHAVDIDTPAFLVAEDLMVLELHREERDVGSGSGMGSSGNSLDLDYPDHDVMTETIDPVRIRSLHVTSSVTARYAKTVVTSHVLNPANQSQEVNFKMELPKEAFISGFLIETEGQVFYSIVDEKQKAQKAYDTAKKQGQTAGQVKQTSEKKNTFTISINAAAGSMLSFNLTYEELLKRKDGYFENSIFISPGQIVDHLFVVVHISEPQGLDENKMDYFVARPQSSYRNTEVLRPLWATMTQLHRTRSSVQFHPKPEEQQVLSASGNLGKFVVRYDVIHEQNAGNMQIVNGYFVHHFSPEGFKPTQKNVVFVLDTSGSMSGTKIRQTREAMETILSDLREKDEFGIVTFASSTRAWRPSMVPANRENIQSAKNEIRRLYASGGTNLHGGIVDAIAMLEEAEHNAVSTVGTFSLIIMLTDGQPTAGTLTDTNSIKADIRRRLEGRFSLFCLGFGEGVNYPFLEQLSLQNRGLARKIYADSDAGLQLVGFFDEVATPLLVNVQISYQDNMIVTNSISETVFPTYFEGTELVVAGQLALNDSHPDVLVCVVTAETQNAHIQLEMEVNVTEESDVMLSPHAVDDFAQRLWAFLTIKELLRKRIAADGRDERDALTQRALEISLKYHFVTPLTSLVVVKPDDEHVIDDVEPDIAADAPELPSPKSVQAGPVAPRGQTGPVGPIGQAGPIGPGGRGRFLMGPQAPVASHGKTAPVRNWAPPTASRTSVDSDPHFIVHDPRGNITVCFDIMGRPGDVFSLIQDPLSGIYINGHVASVHFHTVASSGTVYPTVFNRLAMNFNGQQVLVTATSITIGQALSMTWDTNWAVELDGGLTLSVRKGKYLVIQPKTEVSLVVLRHDVERHHVDKSDYFGLYVENGDGFSHKVHGIIGQFQRRKIHLERKSVSVDGDRVKGYIRVLNRRVEVIKSERRDLLTAKVEQCWYAGNNAHGVIDGSYTDYLVEG